MAIKTFTLKGNAASAAAYAAGRDAIKSGYPALPVSPVGQSV